MCVYDQQSRVITACEAAVLIWGCIPWLNHVSCCMQVITAYNSIASHQDQHTRQTSDTAALVHRSNSTVLFVRLLSDCQLLCKTKLRSL